MPRYADIDTVRDALYEADAITMKGVRILNQFPTISHDEVRGVGEWRFERSIVHDGEPWCSECGEGFEIRAEKMKYCPNCGCKMRYKNEE